jgi:Protein of unknown function (DUF3168)
MPSPDNALQAAVFQRLTAYTPLTAALDGRKVYDYVSPGHAAPYVVIGEDTLADNSTKTENGWDCTLTLHVWDFEKAGRKSVKNLLSLIFDSLHRQESAVTVAGYALTELRWDGFQDTIQETSIQGENDHYYHGVTRYRALLEPA